MFFCRRLLLAAIAAIFKALGEGCLTPDEITALSLVVGRCIEVIELQDFERRIAALEQARDKRDEKEKPPAGSSSRKGRTLP